MVPEASVGRANAIIFAGISVGTVVGVPAGTLIGDAFGWRASFAAIAGFGSLVLAAQLAFLKPLPPSEVVSLRHLVALFRIPKARLGLLGMLLVVTGQFGAFTYMGAFLEQVTLASPALVSSLLLGYGITGFFGNFAGGAAAQRSAFWTLTGTSIVLGGAIILLPPIGYLEIPAAILILLWGFAFGALPIAMQGWMLKAAPEEMESASAMFISALQVGLALGACLGGVVVDRFGLDATMSTFGCVALLTGALLWVFGRDRSARFSRRG